MRTLTVLLVVAGAALVATCSSSSSTPNDGGPGGPGGQAASGGRGGSPARDGGDDAGGTGGLPASGGTGGTLELCRYGLGGFGGANGLGGTNGPDGSIDAGCVPNPLAGCPASPASCGSGAICATSSQNGRLELQTCMPVPSGCDSCSCLEDAMVDFARQFPDVSIPVGACSCFQGQQRVDGGTAANPITSVGCSGA